MGFFDFNIPYHESDRHAMDKSSLRGRRLKLALKVMELGYTGVAYSRTLKGVMSESDRCSIQFFPLSKLIPSSSSFFSAVKFHRELLNVAVSSPFRQYTRLTLIVELPSQVSALNAGNPILRSYDIVAIRPVNQNTFDQACQTAEVDMIAIDFSDKLPFRLKQPMVKAAIQRGVYFEITYSGLIADAQTRRQVVSNCKLLVDWTRGKNLIICSGASSVTELRGPQDITNLFSLLGLPSERAKAAISKNCRSLLGNALRKRHFYKGAIKVEPIRSGEQQSPFDDWLKWDSISSGQGDLLLEEMEKSFAISNTQTERFVNFNTSMPAHGLQIKDLISVTKSDLQPPEMIVLEPVAVEIDTVEKNKEPGGLHEGKSSVLENKDSVTNLSKEQASSSLSACRDSKVPLDYVPNGLPEEGEPSPNNAQFGNQAPDSAMSSFPIHFFNSEENIRISRKNLNCSNDLETNLVASEPSRVVVENGLHDGGEDTIKIETPITCRHVLADLLSPLNESSFLDCRIEEYRRGLGVCDSENKHELPMVVSFDTPAAQDVYVEEEHNCDDSDGMPIEGLLKTDLNEPICDVKVNNNNNKIDPVTNYRDPGESSSGRERRKRKSPHQPFLFPFKRFLNHRSSKRK